MIGGSEVKRLSAEITRALKADEVYGVAAPTPIFLDTFATYQDTLKPSTVTVYEEKEELRKPVKKEIEGVERKEKLDKQKIDMMKIAEFGDANVTDVEINTRLADLGKKLEDDKQRSKYFRDMMAFVYAVAGLYNDGKLFYPEKGNVLENIKNLKRDDRIDVMKKWYLKDMLAEDDRDVKDYKGNNYTKKMNVTTRGELGGKNYYEYLDSILDFDFRKYIQYRNINALSDEYRRLMAPGLDPGDVIKKYHIDNDIPGMNGVPLFGTLRNVITFYVSLKDPVVVDKLTNKYSVSQKLKDDIQNVNDIIDFTGNLSKHSNEITKLKDRLDKITKEEEAEIREILASISDSDYTLSKKITDPNKLLRPLMAGDGLAISFENISQYSSYNRLMTDNNTYPDNKTLLIIYRSEQSFGHWVGLFQNKYGINYFNSYGTYIDQAIDNIPEKFASDTGQNFPHLLKLLSEAPLDVFYNDVKLQADTIELSDEVIVPQTCGRYVGWMFWNALHYPDRRMEDVVKSIVQKAKKEEASLCDVVITKVTEPLLKVYDKSSDKKNVTWLHT